MTLASVEGRLVVVTGAAGGLGEALAVEAAAREAASIAIIDVDEAAAQDVAARISASGTPTQAFTCDISDVDAISSLADKIVVLNAGRVEQVGRPMDLYNDPDNAFVAGFIGSPKMNFLKSQAMGEQGETVGVRPEHLAISRDAGAIAGRISHVEKLGSETLIYVRAEPHGLLTVRQFGEQDFAVEEAVYLTPDAPRAFRFDAGGMRMR